MTQTTTHTPLAEYIEQAGPNANPAFVSYLANLQQISAVNPAIARSIIQELEDQRNNLKLIAS